MPELIPADNTVKALIVALLEMPLDAEVEVSQPDVYKTRSIVSVSEPPGIGCGQRYVTLELNDA